MMDLDKLKALAQGATPGPWSFEPDYEEEAHGYPGSDPEPPMHEPASVKLSDKTSFSVGPTKDAAYIAAASPDVVLELIGRIERLRAKVVVDAIMNTDTHSFDSLEKAKTHCEKGALCHDDFYDVVGDNLALRTEAGKQRALLKEAGEVLESYGSAVWDSLYGKGLSKSYAQGIDHEVKTMVDKIKGVL